MLLYCLTLLQWTYPKNVDVFGFVIWKCWEMNLFKFPNDYLHVYYKITSMFMSQVVLWKALWKSLLLCCSSLLQWIYKQGKPFPVTDSTSMSAVRQSLVILLNSVKKFTPCNHGNRWKLQKFHVHLHLPMDIYLFGSPQNYDNSPTEHGLIDTAKRPGNHA